MDTLPDLIEEMHKYADMQLCEFDGSPSHAAIAVRHFADKLGALWGQIIKDAFPMEGGID